ncbi:hypothetical protein [Actinoplanes sp. NBRC 103695]|nr:hypothetical protein [Actinoplanes sp. NBRC 103695]
MTIFAAAAGSSSRAGGDQKAGSFWSPPYQFRWRAREISYAR